ncbi:TadE/TadG family type IV pilus assembly protein [Sphingomonas sp. LB2R24]
MRSKVAKANTVLGRLRRDIRGNTLAIMAAALIPLCAIAGSAIDMARLYVVKSRMQQACDAGVLAGRKFMTDSESKTLEKTAADQAGIFFANNLRAGWIGTSNVNFVPVKTTENRVAGTATVVVPMTIMKAFMAPDVTLSVTCEARYDVADTDVLFVLDTTGSMACLPSDSEATCSAYVNTQVNNNAITSYSRPARVPADAASGYDGLDQTNGYAGTVGYAVPEKSGSRIAALRKAVVDFYSTMDSNIQATTHVRYGFVTYSSSVNTGAAVQAKSMGYMIGSPGARTTWDYQSRKVTADRKEGIPIITTNTTSQKLCPTAANPTVTRTPSATPSQPFTYNPSTLRATVATQYWDTVFKVCTTSTQTVSAVWTYQSYPWDVTNYVAGNSVADPTEINGASSAWLGCIEERVTTAKAMTFDTDNLPADLDPDLVPSNDDTRWRPLWPDVEYQRFSSTNVFTTNTINVNDNGGNANLWEKMNSPTKQKGGWVACGKPVQRLTTMTKAQVQAYVSAADFVALGGTYHDVGMIWGTRMMSTSGIFADDNAPWPGRGATNKVIIFLTDGDMSPSPYGYGLYGMEYYDGRVTGGDLGTDRQKAYHNARLLAECAKAQNMQIDVWTVSIAPSATAEMTKCATTADQALFTTSGEDLSAAFIRIAKQVARLRLSK